MGDPLDCPGCCCDPMAPHNGKGDCAPSTEEAPVGTQSPGMVKLDLGTPQAKRDAAAALPVLMLGSAMGNTTASQIAGQIVGQALADALAPSIAAFHRLAAYREEN